MTYKCPNDPTHESERPDNCSICGARIAQTPAAAEEPVEITAIGNSVLVNPNAGVLTSQTPILEDAVEPEAPRTRIELVAEVDPSVFIQPNPRTQCPVGQAPKRFPIEKTQSLIGRRSDQRAIYPEFALNDPGVSHKHAMIFKEADGSLVLQDIGSANGTQINGKDVQSGVRIALCVGDQIVLGCWTRITVESVAY